VTSEHGLPQGGSRQRAAVLGRVAGRDLAEIVERTDHPWFIGVQFHPELKSKPFEPHPLFASFVAARWSKAGWL